MARSSPRTRFSLIVYESFLASTACGVNASSIRSPRCVKESFMVACGTNTLMQCARRKRGSDAFVTAGLLLYESSEVQNI